MSSASRLDIANPLRFVGPPFFRLVVPAAKCVQWRGTAVTLKFRAHAIASLVFVTIINQSRVRLPFLRERGGKKVERDMQSRDDVTSPPISKTEK